MFRPFRPRPPSGESTAPAEEQESPSKEGQTDGEQVEGQPQKPRRQFGRRRQRKSESGASKVSPFSENLKRTKKGLLNSIPLALSLLPDFESDILVFLFVLNEYKHGCIIFSDEIAEHYINLFWW